MMTDALGLGAGGLAAVLTKHGGPEGAGRGFEETSRRTMMTENLEPGAGVFSAGLTAPGRSPEIPAAADIYGWLIGSWELDVRHFGVDVTARRIHGEAHFAWILEGHAVQDVWIAPRRGERTADMDKTVNMYGTTVRLWDPALAAWRVTWLDPATGRRDQLIGRWSAKDVVQVGTNADGRPIRWIFDQITPDSFRWTGEALNPDGKTWKLEGEFRARRAAASQGRPVG